MRNLINADTRLAELTQELVALHHPAAWRALKLDEADRQTRCSHALASIADNPDLAEQQITFAESSGDQGREALRTPRRRTGAGGGRDPFRRRCDHAGIDTSRRHRPRRGEPAGRASGCPH